MVPADVINSGSIQTRCRFRQLGPGTGRVERVDGSRLDSQGGGHEDSHRNHDGPGGARQPGPRRPIPAAVDDDHDDHDAADDEHDEHDGHRKHRLRGARAERNQQRGPGPRRIDGGIVLDGPRREPRQHLRRGRRRRQPGRGAGVVLQQRRSSPRRRNRPGAGRPLVCLPALQPALTWARTWNSS